MSSPQTYLSADCENLFLNQQPYPYLKSAYKKFDQIEVLVLYFLVVILHNILYILPLNNCSNCSNSPILEKCCCKIISLAFLPAISFSSANLPNVLRVASDTANIATTINSLFCSSSISIFSSNV